jgi:catechol 2,3-dioxygenase-like lactoylglutathione lyase family enzyme
VPTRLVHLAVDSASPSRNARFWAAVLGWEVVNEDPDETGIEPAGYGYPSPEAVTLAFVPVPEPKQGKNRVHLDLATSSPEHQQAEVERIAALGATRADIGQGDVPWVVMRDPEGNEFCVLDPQPAYPEHGIGAIIMDCADPAAIADFWQLATGWKVTGSSATGTALRHPDGIGPFLVLLKVAGAKTVKNRIHIDIAPEKGEDLSQALSQLIQAGAIPVDVGQGEMPWHVLADPEGNEFCLLTPR